MRKSQVFLFYVDGRNPLLFGVADLGASFDVRDVTETAKESRDDFGFC